MLTLNGVELKLGDIILTHGTSQFPRLIRWFEALQSPDKQAMASHAGMYLGTVNGKPKVVESYAQIKIGDLSKYEGRNIAIVRFKGHTATERETVADFSVKVTGNMYSFWRLPLFALDGLASFIRRKPVYYFTSKFGVSTWQVCSTFAAYAWVKHGNHKFDQDWRSISPEYFYDLAKRLINNPCQCTVKLLLDFK